MRYRDLITEAQETHFDALQTGVAAVFYAWRGGGGPGGTEWRA